MTHPNEDLARAASAAFGRGDLGARRPHCFAEPAAQRRTIPQPHHVLHRNAVGLLGLG